MQSVAPLPIIPRRPLRRLNSSRASLSTLGGSLSSNASASSLQSSAAALANSHSTILNLPSEILQSILIYVLRDDTLSFSEATSMFARDVVPVCRVFYEMGMPLLYQHVAFQFPRSFDLFSRTLAESPQLREFVKCMDFSTFTSIGLGRTNKMNQEIEMVTSKTITRALDMCTNLTEFLSSESIQEDVDSTVFSKLFSMPDLQAVDFCGSSGAVFFNAFLTASIPDSLPNIKRISFHDCTGLTNTIFQSFLPKLVNLERLDLSHTQISYRALVSLPSTCQITHLALSRCGALTGYDIFDFLMNHPAMKNSTKIRWLSVAADPAASVAPLHPKTLTKLLNNLCPEIRYLNLAGISVGPEHLSIIKQRFRKLVSLSLAHSSLPIEELITFLQPESFPDEYGNEVIITPRIRFLDLAGNKTLNQWNVQRPDFLDAGKYIEAFEFSSQITEELDKPGCLRSMGGKRKWYTRIGKGRRTWIFKVDPDSPFYNIDLSPAAQSLSYWDPVAGKMMKPVAYVPKFLAWASRKVCCSLSLHLDSYLQDEEILEEEQLDDNDWIFPTPAAERGIYKYYGLRK